MFSNQKINRITIKNTLIIITYTIFLVICAIHFQDILAFIKSFYNLCTPFIWALGIAFVFNIPLKYLLSKLPEKIKGRKIIATIGAFIMFLVVFIFIFRIVGPQVIDSIVALINNLPAYIEDTQATVVKFLSDLNLDDAALAQVDIYTKQFSETALNFLSGMLPRLIDLTKSVTESITNLFLAIVIAVYLSVSKDKLLRQLRKVSYAFLPENIDGYITHAGKLANKTFAGFISGQMVEAIIIGLLCYIGCTVLGTPYAPIVSVVIGCTNVIPIFGPIIGTGICGTLILFVSPIQALIFVIFGICLQQFESNLIYPRVVGSSVGLSGLWVLFAITIGGGLFGIMGMVLGLPTFAVVYTLLSEEVNRRIEKKRLIKIKEESDLEIEQSLEEVI
ncbi:MAG: AI-2E family transporter [Erysipelotrichaceae bacterium]